jgi:hypothetical protein
VGLSTPKNIDTESHRSGVAAEKKCELFSPLKHPPVLTKSLQKQGSALQLIYGKRLTVATLNSV